MLANIRDIFIIVMALVVAVLCVVLIVAVVGLYPAIDNTVSNLSDATATLNRVLNDAEDITEGLVDNEAAKSLVDAVMGVKAAADSIVELNNAQLDRLR